MPIWFIIGFLGISVLFPRLARFTLIGPVLALTFGGFAWSVFGLLGVMPISVETFMISLLVAYVIVIFLTRD